jgi:SAM-dependent methyltransferase
MTDPAAPANYHLKEDIRSYWSDRAATFDLAFGHRIPSGPEADAWGQAIRAGLGAAPCRVLELACGTGEVTRLLHDLGHQVTALDFSETMLRQAKAKHAGKGDRLRFLLADAEATYLPAASFDAILCRHLVWTLTDPAAGFAEWLRLLVPGGRLVVFDGDWSKPYRLGRWAAAGVALIDRLVGPDTHYDGALGARHGDIMRRLPFGDGLSADRLVPLLADAGFVEMTIASHGAIAAAQRRRANLRDKLRTCVYRRFILRARKPG